MFGEFPEAISPYCRICLCSKGALEFKYFKVINHGIYGWCTCERCEDHTETWDSAQWSCNISKLMQACFIGLEVNMIEKFPSPTFLKLSYGLKVGLGKSGLALVLTFIALHELATLETWNLFFLLGSQLFYHFRLLSFLKKRYGSSILAEGDVL